MASIPSVMLRHSEASSSPFQRMTPLEGLPTRAFLRRSRRGRSGGLLFLLAAAAASLAVLPTGRWTGAFVTPPSHQNLAASSSQTAWNLRRQQPLPQMLEGGGRGGHHNDISSYNNLNSRYYGPAGLTLRRLTALKAFGPSNADPAALEALLKDPQKMKELQAEVDQVLADPRQRQALEAFQKQVQSGVERLRQDPEMKQYFEDVEKYGIDALKKYENDEKIMKKIQDATGDPATILQGLSAATNPSPSRPEAQAPTDPPLGEGLEGFLFGQQVEIVGLKAKPELNGEAAIVLPPTPAERASLKGTARLIVRLLRTGEQFSVKASNLQSNDDNMEDMSGSPNGDSAAHLGADAATLGDISPADDAAAAAAGDPKV